MSISKHHQEWLSLLEISGPFLAMPVITKVFPHGLPKFDSAIKKELRIAYQEWMGSQEDPNLQTSYHTAWIRFVLKEVLGFPTELIAEGPSIPPGYNVILTEHGEQLSPDAAIVVPEGRENAGRARILFVSYPSNQPLERALPSSRSRWGASPATRMMELLRRTSSELGVVTNGEQWMLVYAPARETTTFVSWYASVWMEEDITLLSFHALLSIARLFGVSSDETLEALFRASTEFQQEVTDQLGLQVRKAVELLIQALDRIDKDTGRKLLKDVSVKQLYEAGVSVMMRLVFLLAAEERGLFPLNNEIYSSNYAVSTLREQLQESASRYGESVLEHRFDAWNRLLATFRVIHAGARHEDLNSPAYGGSLFDPDKYPFLEGRHTGTIWYETEVDPLAINNRTVLHMLDSLQLLKGRGPRDEARRLSFRAIDVEQIGNVYESLLEHTAVRASEPVLGLVGSKGKEPEVPLSALQSRRAIGETALVTWLAEETGRSDKALSKLLYQLDKFPESKCLMVCDNDDAVYTSVKPFMGLVREDTLDMPVVFTPGSVYVTEGSERRSTGTHYTPRSLTEPIVEHTLSAIVYSGAASGIESTPETLRSPSEILELKICDMTCGSGAFLVQACRYLADKLVESWDLQESKLPTNSVLTFDGAILQSDLLTDLKRVVPTDLDDRLMFARRLIADRCLYGVDCNPMAVEMAKLSIWLTTLQRERPFTFLDHAIKCGDSLIGISNLEHLRYFDLCPDMVKPPRRLSEYTAEIIESAKDKRVQLEEIAVGDICDTELKERLNNKAEEELTEAKLIGDLLVGVTMRKGSSTDLERGLDEVSLSIAAALVSENSLQSLLHKRKEITQQLMSCSLNFINRAPFHWIVEFPEVFLRSNPGFDAIVGNPPFIGGKKITGSLGSEYRDYLLAYLAGGKRGHADLCAYFFLRACELTRTGGNIGLLATNSISEGDTREVGLDKITSLGNYVFRAIKSRKWPGAANLEVALIWIHKGTWTNKVFLDEREVPGISSYVSSQTEITGKPHSLVLNSNMSFTGSYVLGMGFMLSPTEAEDILQASPKCQAVLLPFLTGEDVNKQPDQSASRFVINFFDWPMMRADVGDWESSTERDRQTWLNNGIVPLNYVGDVAADYPECFAIVERLVKPERTRTKDNGEFALRYPLFLKWWIYADKRPALYRAIANLPRVVVISRVSKYLITCWQPTTQVISDRLTVVARSEDFVFALLQSTIHELWAKYFGSTLRVDNLYTPEDCFETFPFPTDTASLDEIGKRYHSTRENLTQQFQEGLTKLYNRVHSKTEKNSTICQLRTVHVEMDNAVLAAYGWSDIVLDHDFRSTDKGERYTISQECKQEILRRLFVLNQERHAEEESKGLIKVKKTGKRAGKEASQLTSDAGSGQIQLDLRTTTSVGATDDE